MSLRAKQCYIHDGIVLQTQMKLLQKGPHKQIEGDRIILKN